MINVMNELLARKELIKKYELATFGGWDRLKMSTLDLPSYAKSLPLALESPLISVMKELLPTAIKPAHTEIDEKLFLHNQAFYNSGFTLTLGENERIENPIYVEMKTDKNHSSLVDYNRIIAGKGSHATLILHYKQQDSTPSFHNGYTDILAHPYSQLKIIKIYEYDNASTNFDTNVSKTLPFGNVDFVTVDFTQGTSVTQFINELDEGSHTHYHSIYLGQNASKMDHHYKMVHLGKNSESYIDVKGALTDTASKIFRGTLDFRKGSKGSKGVEKEYVTLLSPLVKSHAIPALLCSEDDVEGEHAASAGQIDVNKLYYLMSRGLSLSGAKKLLVEASFSKALQEIPTDDLRNHVSKLVLKGLDAHAK